MYEKVWEGVIRYENVWEGVRRYEKVWEFNGRPLRPWFMTTTMLSAERISSCENNYRDQRILWGCVQPKKSTMRCYCTNLWLSLQHVWLLFILPHRSYLIERGEKEDSQKDPPQREKRMNRWWESEGHLRSRGRWLDKQLIWKNNQYRNSIKEGNWNW